MFFAGWLLYRSRRDQLARVAPARREAEACAGLLLAVVGAQLVVVALLPTGGLRGSTFPGVPLVACLPAVGALSAWGLRHVPRLRRGAAGAAHAGRERLVARSPSGADTLSGWLDVDTDAPWGPLVAGVPGLHGGRGVAGDPVRAARGGAVVLWWRERRAAGEFRRAAAASRTSKALH